MSKQCLYLKCSQLDNTTNYPYLDIGVGHIILQADQSFFDSIMSYIKYFTPEDQQLMFLPALPETPKLKLNQSQTYVGTGSIS